MTILGDSYLQLAMDKEEIIVNPTNADSIQPNSIDIRLGDHIKYSNPLKDYVYELGGPLPEYLKHSLLIEPYVLQPSEFALGVTYEHIIVPDFLSCTLEGRSSIGRLGLFVINAGRVDSGWNGKLTLELYNAEKFPIKLERLMPVGQLVFSDTIGVTKPYGSSSLRSKYQGDMQAEPSKLR